MNRTAATTVDDAIKTRHSCRRFTDQAVTREQIEHLLEVARYAPSGSNTQPWQVYVVAGEVKSAVSAAIVADLQTNEERQDREYQYYPLEWYEPYLARRRACGWGLYNSLNIQRGEADKMKTQRTRNFTFFDAPVGLFFTMSRGLETGSYMDVGMFVQSFMVAARGLGLDTCAQAAFANYHELIRPLVGITDDEILICGLAVGYSDSQTPENQFRTEREPVDGFTTWSGL